MKYPTVLALLTALSFSASAQQVQATYLPVTIDGVTTPKGSVTIDGKTYVSQDALRARGVTVLKPNSLGLYSFPRGSGPTLKLKGCQNEWLFNGTLRLKVTETSADPGGWRAYAQAQNATSGEISISSIVDLGHIIAVSKSGRVYDPNKNPFEETAKDYTTVSRAETQSVMFYLKTADAPTGDPLQKLVLPSTSKDGSGTMTFDLTCTK